MLCCIQCIIVFSETTTLYVCFLATTKLEVDHTNLELFQTVISQTDTYRR